MWKDALLVIFQRKRLISFQEEHRWKSCPHDVVAWMSISALSWLLSSIIQNGQRHKELRQVSTMTSDILALKDWLKAAGCRQIAMESTGVYWKPIFHLLEDEFEMVLVNAQHMKAVAFPKNGCERCGMDSGSAPTRLVESQFHSQQRATSCARSDPEPDELAPGTKSPGQSGAKGA